MPDEVSLQAARIPDRDRLLAALLEAGLEARAVGEVSIAVSILDASEAPELLYRRTERLVFAIGAPFVPQQHEGVVYLRPPIG